MLNKLLALPFVSIYSDIKENTEIYCVVNALTKENISYYNLAKLKEQDTDDFISLITYWYNKSDRKIPLTVYFQEKIAKFKYMYEVCSTKKLEYVSGFETIPLRSIGDKRIKRTIITIPESS